jgi:hypothetical protein
MNHHRGFRATADTKLPLVETEWNPVRGQMESDLDFMKDSHHDDSKLLDHRRNW